MKNINSISIISMEESDILCAKLLDAGVFSGKVMRELGVRHKSLCKCIWERAALKRRFCDISKDDTTDTTISNLAPSLESIIAGLDRWTGE